MVGCQCSNNELGVHCETPEFVMDGGYKRAVHEFTRS